MINSEHTETCIRATILLGLDPDECDPDECDPDVDCRDDERHGGPLPSIDNERADEAASRWERRYWGD